MTLPKKTTVNVIPTMRYQDAPAAIEWLCRAFGFEKHLVVPGESKQEIAHAELCFGNGMIMLGSAGKHGGGFDDLMTTPREIGGRETQSAYVIVEDPASHHDRAVAAGARIVMPLEKKDYGGSGYSCSDPEGHVWVRDRIRSARQPGGHAHPLAGGCRPTTEFPAMPLI